jgi:hypothetical protein
MQQADGGRENDSGAGNRLCLVSSSPQSYRFRFLGGNPGWAVRQERGTIETVILVSPDGKPTGRIERIHSYAVGKIRINGVGYAAANRNSGIHTEVAVVKSQCPVASTGTTATTLWAK